MIDRAGYDPIDLHLDQLGAAGRTGAAGSRQAAAPLWTSGMQAVLLLVLGMACGPAGLGLLTANVLTLLDPALPVALAALGVLAGLSISQGIWTDRRFVLAGSVEALLSGALVAGGILAIAPIAYGADAERPWVLAFTAGLCASASSAFASQRGGATDTAGARIADRDVLVVIVVGGLLIAQARYDSLLAPPWLTLQAGAVAIVVAIVGWLLLTSAISDTEQRVFNAATLLVLGGMADYLSLSPLLAGFVAGAFWQRTSDVAGALVRRDLAHVQHPLLALVLLAAGARVEFSAAILILALAYALVRAAAKLAAGRLIAGTGARPTTGDGARALLAPGIFGVAFALHAARAMGDELGALISVVVLGTIGAQLMAGSGAGEAAE